MVARSGQLPNAHFRKHWQRHVKTGFDTAAKAKRRQLVRREKQARLGLRPLGLLRPVVSCQTKLHNMRLRLGKGFSFEELKSVKLSPKVAPSIGIAVDKRRVNRSEESLARNVERLQEYLKRVVVFPRRSSRARRGVGGIPDDTLRSDMNDDSFVLGKSMKQIFPVPKVTPPVEFRAPSAEERDMKVFEAFQTARKAYRPVKEKDENGKPAGKKGRK